MSLRAASVSIALAVAVTACGGSSKKTTSTDAAPATSAASPTTSPTATTTGTTPASTSTGASPGATTTTAAGPPPCTAADLTGSFLGGQGATGHGLLGFALHNTSGRSCHTFGFPGVVFLDRAGRALPTVSTRTTTDFFGTAPKVRLLLGPGSGASFRLGVTHGAVSTAHCTSAYAVQVIPPDDTRTLVIKIPGGAYECGTATVSPLRPGTSAFP
jgi:hypothetical protein